MNQVRQNRNVHDYLADLDSEVPLYMKVQEQKWINFDNDHHLLFPISYILQAGQLVNFLASWTPPPGSQSPQETVTHLKSYLINVELNLLLPTLKKKLDYVTTSF